MEIRLDIVAMIIAIISTIVWLIRLEGRVNTIDKMNAETQKDVDHLRNDNRTIYDTLATIRESLARIEGALLTRQKQNGE